MAELRVDHPDILEFIDAKTTEGDLVNFNISVSVSDAFMTAVREDTPFVLHFDGQERFIDARWLWQKLYNSAWKLGDPGVVFIDRMNADNPLAPERMIAATNPCGEVPLLPWEACTLGSINLANFVDRSDPDGIAWRALLRTVTWAITFLDAVVEVNKSPVPQIDFMTRQTRRLGLGVMGWASLLNELEIGYDTEVAIELAEKLGRAIRERADKTSELLARRLGAYPLSPDGRFRNIARLSIAPTGSISTIADTSAGIEPYFSRKVVRKLAIGEITEEYPNSDKPWFRTAMEIDPIWHVRHQAAWQKYVDNAVSKTINMRRSSTPDDVRAVYELAYQLGCKGITIYRDGSRELQVYNKVEHAEFNKCPSCGSFSIEHKEGCETCASCGWTACTV